ncbi:hypothetical protein KRR40_32500 [Niabella defluvii]|nr:hypothetical protein KRR40_32500 [Niabella sp. I65]
MEKENALAELKTELAAVDRKIQLSIKPESEGKTTDQVEGETPVSDNSETTAYVKGVHLPRGVL